MRRRERRVAPAVLAALGALVVARGLRPPAGAGAPPAPGASPAVPPPAASAAGETTVRLARRAATSVEAVALGAAASTGRELREALVGMAPTTFKLPGRIPASARLAFALGAADGPATFVVEAVDEEGASRELFRRRLAGDARWVDATVDLGASAGRATALRLRAERADPAAPARIAWGAPRLLVRAPPAVVADVLWVVAPGLRFDVRAAPGPALAELLARGARTCVAQMSAAPAGAALIAMLAGSPPHARPGGAPPEASLGDVLAGAGMATAAFVDAASPVVDPRALGVDVVAVEAGSAAVARRAAAVLAAPRAGRSFTLVRLAVGDDAAAREAALATLLGALDARGARASTVVVLTADTADPDAPPLSDAATRVPLVLAGPGLAEGAELAASLRGIDVAPTVLDLLGLEPPDTMRGRTLRAAAPGARVLVTEAEGARALRHGDWRLVVQDGPPRTRALFDLAADPRERRDLAAARAELVAELEARLAADLVDTPAADAPAPIDAAPPVTRLRFAFGPTPRRISGTIRVGGDVAIVPVDLGEDAIRRDGARATVAFRTDPAVAVGLDLVGRGPIAWDLWVDDAPLATVLGGPYGLASTVLLHGLDGEAARRAAAADALPAIDPARDRGLFVVRRRGAP